MKKIQKHQFTLIELLAVVGLLALLIGIFVPAFSSLMQGGAVDQSASVFKSGLEVAQAKAIAARKYVAVIMPSKYDEISDPKLQPYCNGGYRLAFVTGNSGRWVFNGWVPGSTWSNGSDGAMLTAIEQRKNWWDDDGKFKDLPGTKSDLDEQFTGAGLLTEIHLAEGTAKADADADLNALRAADATGESAENWSGIIFTPFGGCVGGDTPLLFFFTEAKVSSGAYEYANEDNFVVLKLNPITGKVVYLPREDEDE